MYQALSLTDEYNIFTKYERVRLLNHPRKHSYQVRFVDELIEAVPELKMVMEHIKGFSIRWYKTLRGYLLNRYRMNMLYFRMNPQQIGSNMSLVLVALYPWLKEYMQRITKLLIAKYGYKNTHYHFFRIPRGKLVEMSSRYAELFEEDAEYLEGLLERIRFRMN